MRRRYSDKSRADWARRRTRARRAQRKLKLYGRPMVGKWYAPGNNGETR